MSEMGMAMMGTGVSSGDNRARLAAEAAIASPLLEDVDLSGAKGVLVNLTAGLDLSIGEFEEVGEVMKAITSDGATVVVGTVIDPELRDEVRVTVIVTGLGRKQVSGGARMPSIETINPKTLEMTADYEQFDKPAILRRQSAASLPRSEPVAPPPVTPSRPVAVSEKIHDIDYLDIPAFLRRKEEDA
jgi:cell division protein FtsZ